MAASKKGIKFLTDSASDIPEKLRREYDIEMMPFPIIYDNKEYYDSVDFTPTQFFDWLEKLPSTPTHSQLTAFTFCAYYERFWGEGYRSLIYTSINGKGSNTLNNAIQARDEFFEDHPEAKADFEIIIIDGCTYTMAYGWGVVLAAKMAKAGESAQACADAIVDWAAHTRILFTPMDLKFAKKSGRISAAAAFLGDKLGLHPIMTFENGESKSLSKVRGDRNVIPTMVKMFQSRAVEGTPYLIIHGNNKANNKELTKTFTEALGRKPDLEYYVGGVVTINAGPNLVGVLFRQAETSADVKIV